MSKHVVIVDDFKTHGVTKEVDLTPEQERRYWIPAGTSTAPATRWSDELELRGDVPGHQFHGNQYTGGLSAGETVDPIKGGGGVGKTGKPLSSVSASAGMSSFPQDLQDRIAATLAKNAGGLTQEQATRNLLEVAAHVTSQNLADGAQWYAFTHSFAAGEGSGYHLHDGKGGFVSDELVNQTIKDSGLTPQQMSGVIAALSPRQQWPSNMAGAFLVADAVAYHDGVLQRSIGIGGNTDKALAIANGGSPDNELGGPKVRSFFNNITTSGASDDVTMDMHMVAAAVGGRNDGTSARMAALYDAKGNMKLPGTAPAYNGATVGAYPALADAVRDAAAQFNNASGSHYTVAQFQAIVWMQQKEDFPNPKDMV